MEEASQGGDKKRHRITVAREGGKHEKVKTSKAKQI